MLRQSCVQRPGVSKRTLQGSPYRDLRLDEDTRPADNGCYGVQVADDDLAVLKATYGPEQGYSGKYKDDLTGQVFKDALVLQARAVKLQYFNSK